MKVLISTLFVSSLISFNLTAENDAIFCQKDLRMAGGALNEVTLSLNPDGYILQTRLVQSLNSTINEITNIAEKLTCRFDEKAPLAFCQNPDGTKQVQIKERKITSYDSLMPDEKKKTAKYTDIEVTGGAMEENFSFDSGGCKLIKK